MLVQNIHSFSHFMTNYCYKMFLFVTCTDLFFFKERGEAGEFMPVWMPRFNPATKQSVASFKAKL